jgi:internalin A
MKLVLAKSKRSISFMMILALILNVGYFLDGKVYGSTGTDIRIHTNINNLQAIQFKDQVYLKWTGINHAKGYNVYRSNVSGQFEYPVTDFLTTTNNFYLDKNFGTAHNLYYIVKPVFDNSSEGSSSNEARVEAIKVSKVVLQIDNPVMIINDVFSINIDPAAPAVSPRLENGRTMLPIRSLVETLGGSVSWKPETRQIVINIEDKDIVFTLDQVAYTLNGQNKMFDVAPQIFENRTFVPVRAISQLLQGFTTNWKSDTRQVEILSSTHTLNLDTLPPTLPTSPNPTETNILKKQFPLSISDDKPVSLILENRSNELIEFYWIDYVGKPILYNRVLPGENAHLLSYATHSWVIADSNQNLITNFIASDIELQNYTLSPDKKLLSSLPPVLTDAEKENIVIENMKALETILQPIQDKYPRMIGADWGNQDKFNDAIADAIFAAINRNPHKFKNPFNNLSAFEQGPADANASTKPVTVRLFNYGASNMQASYEFYDTQLNNGSYSRSKMEGTILVALYSDDQTTDPRQFRLTIMGFGKGGRTLSTPRNNIIHIPSTILPHVLTDAEKENIVIENMKALETILEPIQYKYPRMIGADWGNQDKFNDAIADAIFVAINRNPHKFKNPFNNLSAFEQGPADANASTKPVTVRLFNYGASNMQASYEFYETQLNNASYSRSKMEGTILVALYSDDQTTDPRQFRLTIMGFGKGGRTLSTPRNNIIHIPSTILPLNKVVVFNDKNLEAAIRAEINKPRGEVYANDLKDITILNLTGKNITNISALANVTNLKELYLSGNNSGNKITDISALANLTNLYFLDLSDNNIRDISALRNLTKLEWLELNGNNITDISALKNLTNLVWLVLNGNSIIDISALANLTKLEWLELTGNSITDISALANLRNLQSLGLSGNKIKDFSVLDRLPYIDRADYEGQDLNKVVVFNDKNLEAAIRAEINKPRGEVYANDLKDITILNLTGKNITNISALANVTNLKELYLAGNKSGNNITDISALGNLTKLEWLDLSDNNIRDISALRNLTNLKTLYLTGNNITDISALANLTYLEWLYLSWNNITDISALAQLINLERLTLSGNKITDISALAKLTYLEWLYIEGNNITDISALANLTKLESLGLGVNNITDISALANLTKLESLGLSGNNITDISALANLTNLKELHLIGNKITDISALANLTKLEWLYLTDNNIRDISALANLRNLHTLELSGNNITDFRVLDRLPYIDRADYEGQ